MALPTAASEAVSEADAASEAGAASEADAVSEAGAEAPKDDAVVVAADEKSEATADKSSAPANSSGAFGHERESSGPSAVSA